MVKPSLKVTAFPEIVVVPLKVKLPPADDKARVPLLFKLPLRVVALTPSVRVLPLPTDRFPEIGMLPVKPVVLYKTAPPPLAPTEKLPLIVSALAPELEASANVPDVLSRLRL